MQGLTEKYAAAAERGDLGTASSLLDEFLSATTRRLPPGRSQEGMSLLEHAAVVRQALRDQRIDDAATELSNWKIHPPDLTTCGSKRRKELPQLNTLGLLLIDFFAHPAADRHPMSDELVNAQLRHVAQWVKLSEPTVQPDGYFDKVYAEVRSKRRKQLRRRLD